MKTTLRCAITWRGFQFAFMLGVGRVAVAEFDLGHICIVELSRDTKTPVTMSQDKVEVDRGEVKS